MHLNSKKNKIVVTSALEGAVMYKIDATNQIQRLGQILTRRKDR